MSVEARGDLLRRIGEERGSVAILYVTGDRRGLETQIADEVVDLFVRHLDAIRPQPRISLVLHTKGVQTSAAWRLVNLLKLFADHLEVVIPAKALSAGTLMCLGANTVVMTKQATLGPIDPSLTAPLGPSIPGANPQARAPVSVEAAMGYLDIATKELGIKDDAALGNILTNLSQHVHPLVLGEVFRQRSHIRHLARELVQYQVVDEDTHNQIIDFLCSDSGSHDYTINRREALRLGLKVEKPSETFYSLLSEIHQTFADDLKLLEPLDQERMLGVVGEVQYSLPRGIIQSVAGGSHEFVSEGRLTRLLIPGANNIPQKAIADQREKAGRGRKRMEHMYNTTDAQWTMEQGTSVEQLSTISTASSDAVAAQFRDVVWLAQRQIHVTTPIYIVDGTILVPSESKTPDC